MINSAFKKTLIVFTGFILVLVGFLVVIIQRFSQYESLPETVKMVDFSGLLIAVLGALILMLIGIGLTFWLAHAWAIEQPELGEKIIRMVTIINILLIVVFGGLGGGFVILRTLWTIGYF